MWCQFFGIPVISSIFVFRSGFPVIEVYYFLVVDSVFFLGRVLETVEIFGRTEEWRSTSVIEGSSPRIGLTLPTLRSVS